MRKAINDSRVADPLHVSTVQSDGPFSFERVDTWRWFMASLIKATVETGVWSRLSHPAWGLFVAIASHTDGSGRLFVGAARLKELTGLWRSQIFKALAELVEIGLVEIEKRGGGRHANRYQLAKGLEEAGKWSIRLCGVDHARGLPPDHPGGPHAPTRVDCTRPPGWSPRQDLKTGPEDSSKAAAAVRSALKAAGITEPTQSELTGRESLSIATITPVIERWRASRKSVGILVIELRSLADRLDETAADRANGLAATEAAAAERALVRSIPDAELTLILDTVEPRLTENVRKSQLSRFLDRTQALDVPELRSLVVSECMRLREGV